MGTARKGLPSLPAHHVAVLVLFLVSLAFLGTMGGWALGLIQGYRWTLEDEALMQAFPHPSPSQSWQDDFAVLDSMARQARPDLPEPKRHWLVLLILRAAYRHGVDPRLAMSVAITESSLDEKAISPKGAVGIMQLMPFVAEHYGVDPYDTAQNVDTGVRHLAALLSRYRGNLKLALAAYNAGPSRVRTSIPAIRETRRYIRKVQRLYTASHSGGSLR